MLVTLGGALLTIVASLAFGMAILRTVAPHLPRATAPGIGYAALICAAAVLVRAPGRAGTGLVVIAVLALLATYRAREERARAACVAGAAVCVGAVLTLLLLPFLAAGHFGPLGVSMDNDLGFHLGWVYDLAHGPPPFHFFSFGYPLGSESLAACLTRLGLGDEQALIGVTAAAIALTSVSVFIALSGCDYKLRVPIAIAAGLPYLSAGFFGEGSFKEPIMGLLVLTLALATFAPDRSGRGGAGVVLLLTVATVLIFGPPGLIWPLAFVVAREFADRWARPRSSRALAYQSGLALAALGAVALVAELASAVGRQLGASGFQFFLSGPPAGLFGGNFARQLPLTEGLGVWFGRDFRYPYSHGVLSTAAVVLALALFVAAVAALLRAWRTALLLPIAAVIAIYLAARVTTLPYFSAKLMVSAGPLLLLFVFEGLLSLRGATGARAGPAVLVALALLLSVAVVWSSAEALRASPVDDPALGTELESFRPLVAHHTVLFLGDDGWVPEWLRGATLTASGVKGRPFSVQPHKSNQPPFDFDTPDPPVLNTADYIITTNTLDASTPPANWVLVRTTPHYELFARRGTAPARSILNEQSAPGATLDCSQAAGRALAAEPGIAAVRPPPVSSSAWRTLAGATLAEFPGLAATPMGAGQVAFSTLRPMRGRIELSLAYRAPLPITLRVGTVSVQLTPTLEPYGPLWHVAVISTHGGPVSVRLQVGQGRVPNSNAGGLVGPVSAVPARRGDTIVPLRAACGRYVDWYRLVH
jgi:hypothetical protein